MTAATVGRVSRAARYALAAAVIGPLIFVAWLGLSDIRNVPFQDEFATVLDFLLRFRDTKTLHGFLALMFHQENEHLIVTSRLIFLTINGLWGGINFGFVALLGDCFIVAAIGVIAWQQREVTIRLLLAAILSLLIFQLQHFENLFLSYASIDHFHIVLLSAASLALLNRGTRWGDVGGGAFALLACVTLAHGFALFPAGALLLILQKRWASLAAWIAVGVLCGSIFLMGLAGTTRPIAAFSTVAGWRDFSRFWLGLLGGVPALGSLRLAPYFGGAALVAVSWLTYRRAWRRDRFLCALAVGALGATFLIAYGRFGFPWPPTSSRYMVQSAVLWSVLSLLLLQELPRRYFASAATVLVLAAAGLNVAADLHFKLGVDTFLNHRQLAARYYFRTGTLRGAPFPIYPDVAVADRILNAAKRTGLYSLEPWISGPAQVVPPIQQRPLDQAIDELTVGPDYVFVRGWVLPPLGRKMAYQPCLVIRGGGQEFVFQGERVDRPDVARVHAMPYASECGFRFDVPRRGLPKGRLNLSLALVGWDGTLMSRTVGHCIN